MDSCDDFSKKHSRSTKTVDCPIRPKNNCDKPEEGKMKISDIISESSKGHKTGPAAQVKGSDPMPKAKKGRTKHPYTGKLVGETSSAGATSAGSIATSTLPKTSKKKRIAKNALDQKSGSIFASGGPIKR
jgi:hypothetical protein